MDHYGISFVVPGNPVPQPRPRVTVRAGHGHAYTPKGHAIHAYRDAVSLMAIAAARQVRHAKTSSPVMLDISCVFGRPMSHLLANGNARPAAPKYPPRCDWDNLGKGICDAITKADAIWNDDDQVVDSRVRKRYAERGEPARTIITVRVLEEAL